MTEEQLQGIQSRFDNQYPESYEDTVERDMRVDMLALLDAVKGYRELCEVIVWQADRFDYRLGNGLIDMDREGLR